MFDDLDDPSFAGPGSGARDAVAARAGRIRRNRRLAWTSGVASVVLLVVALAAVLRPGTQGLAGVEPLRQPSQTATPSETATPSPTAAESPSPTPTVATPSGPYRPPADATGLPPSPAPHVPPRDRIGAWLAENSIHGCDQATELPDAGRAPHSALTMTLDLPDVIDADAPGRGKLTITNTSTDMWATFSFYAANSDRTGGLLQTVAAGNGTFSGATWWREPPRLREHTYGANLDPGESSSYDVDVITETCDPPRRQDQSYKGTVELLAPGTYQMSVGIVVFESQINETEYETPSPTYSPPPACCSRWATAPVTVRVR